MLRHCQVQDNLLSHCQRADDLYFESKCFVLRHSLVFYWICVLFGLPRQTVSWTDATDSSLGFRDERLEQVCPLSTAVRWKHINSRIYIFFFFNESRLCRPNIYLKDNKKTVLNFGFLFWGSRQNGRVGKIFFFVLIKWGWHHKARITYQTQINQTPWSPNNLPTPDKPLIIN